MFENYLKLVHKPGSERGWGCAAGGEKMRDARLGAMARWFCSRWQDFHSGDPEGPAKLGRVVIGVAHVSNAYSPAAANSEVEGKYTGNPPLRFCDSRNVSDRFALTDGWGGGFYQVLKLPKEKSFSFECPASTWIY